MDSPSPIPSPTTNSGCNSLLLLTIFRKEVCVVSFLHIALFFELIVMCACIAVYVVKGSRSTTSVYPSRSIPIGMNARKMTFPPHLIYFCGSISFYISNILKCFYCKSSICLIYRPWYTQESVILSIQRWLQTFSFS